jgi:chromosome segregation ATPase
MEDTIMRWERSFIWVVAVTSLLTLFGCSGGMGDSEDVKRLQADLKDAKDQNWKLQKDNNNLNESLKQTESSLAETADARNKLQRQVEELTTARDELVKSRDDLTAKVGELSNARTELQAKVDDLTQSRDSLQKTVEGLTSARAALEKQVAALVSARNLALEDARNAQGKIDQLNNRIKVQAQQMTELQEQIVNIRTVLERLQKNLQ